MGLSLKRLHTCLVAVLACIIFLPSCSHAQQNWVRWRRQVPPNEWNPWRDPLERFDKHVFASMKYYGEWVKGFSVPMYLDDTYWDPTWSEYPQWYLRRINCFLGIPYATAPVGDRRFQVWTLLSHFAPFVSLNTYVYINHLVCCKKLTFC